MTFFLINAFIVEVYHLEEHLPKISTSGNEK